MGHVGGIANWTFYYLIIYLLCFFIKMENSFFFNTTDYGCSVGNMKYKYFLIKKLEYSNLSRFKSMDKKVTIRKKSYRTIDKVIPFFFHKKFSKKITVFNKSSTIILNKILKKSFLGMEPWSGSRFSFITLNKRMSKVTSRVSSFSILHFRVYRAIFSTPLITDFFLKTFFIHHFIKTFVHNGRLSILYKNFIKIFIILRLVYKLSPFLFFFQVFFLLKLPLRLRIFIKSGRINYIPISLHLYNQYTYLIKLLRQGIYKRNEVSFSLKVLGEVLDILFGNSGNTLQAIRYMLVTAIETKTAIKYKKF